MLLVPGCGIWTVVFVLSDTGEGLSLSVAEGEVGCDDCVAGMVWRGVEARWG